MAATNGTIKATQTLTATAPGVKEWVSIYADLFKARLTLLVLLTTLVGFYVAYKGPVNYLLMFHTIFGTAMVASGAAALNQLLEREHDGRMRRTRNRPLPSGRLTASTVCWVGGFLGAIGVAHLALFTNLLVALLGALSLVLYVAVYTPLKRVTWLNTAVGAIPGGIPPLMGWAAARGDLTWEAIPLFCILAFWQVPHFLAIAWMYKDEYGRAGFKMLPGIDASGKRTGRQSLLTATALLMVSVLPFVFGTAGLLYLTGALLFGAAFAWCALEFRGSLTNSAARKLFFASILYLPLVLACLVLDKLP